MKRFTYVVAILIAAVALVALGWFLGRRTTGNTEVAAKTANTSVSSEVLKSQMFNRDYTEVTITENVIELLDSGRFEDAKHMLRMHQDGGILGLDSIPESGGISAEDMAALRELSTAIQSSEGSMRETANRILGRVARHRTEHPWTYRGNLPSSTNAEVEAKLAAILKRASEKQK